MRHLGERVLYAIGSIFLASRWVIGGILGVWLLLGIVLASPDAWTALSILGFVALAIYVWATDY